MPQALRISYARGVTPGKWARSWGERFPRLRLDLELADAVTDAVAQLAVLRDGVAALAFLRLPADESGEPSWPGGELPGDIHFIALYEERAFAVAPKGSVLEAVDEATAEVTVADLGGEVRHPFDDDVATTIEVVAAGVGVVIVPQSVARLYARKDLIARPVADVPGWRIGIAWLRASDDRRIEDFVGVVRGRTANSSRGATEQTAPAKTDKSAKSAKPAKTAKTARPSADAGARQKRPAGARPSRGARKGRRSTR